MPLAINLAVIVAYRAIDDAGESRGLLRRVIEDELEPRRMPQPQAPARLTAQESGGPSESRRNLVRRMPRNEWREEDTRQPHVGREPHCFLKKEIKPPRRKPGFTSGVVRSHRLGSQRNCAMVPPRAEG